MFTTECGETSLFLNYGLTILLAKGKNVCILYWLEFSLKKQGISHHYRSEADPFLLRFTSMKSHCKKH